MPDPCWSLFALEEALAPDEAPEDGVPVVAVADEGLVVADVEVL